MTIKNSMFQLILTAAAVVTAALYAQTSHAEGLQNEGIQIRGHWRIEITNPDGSLDRIVEFENEFVGAKILTALLTGAGTYGAWAIKAGDNADQLCNEPDIYGSGSSRVGPCLYIELPAELVDPNPYGSLTVEAITQNIGVAGGVELTLLTMEGTTTIDQAGNIQSVETILFTCGPDASAEACAANPLGLGMDFSGGLGGASVTTSGSEQSTFTRKVLDAPEPVTAGQSVTIAVTIRFH